MKPDIQRELIPRDYALHLIGALNAMKGKLLNAAQQWELLGESGHVPAVPSYTGLLQHAADAQDLSCDVVRLAADFARSPHSTNRAGRAVLVHLATAATLSSLAAPRFADTAETDLSLSVSPITRQYRENSMAIDHATARAFLRRTSESLYNAIEELDAHLDFHRFFPTPSRRESPAPAPPRPSARHR
ncbi:hypothetical protein ABZ707_30180 [Streptomyces sp. NPDC006923]|uniref:hypothetical protein n=1 Tax=Streptomyces sp. NPDC006923 TaxID=3155355 RepID=UPI0033DEA411